ncbi:E3 ubiquitin-protein ligase TRIM71-like [Branchiostoma floridae]|uniref:E3 ubiquitin-protein ligase TRIM71-like n=1 Tax=Branchiostoma floridae TaxID=7739 RepID=A0A9J7HEF9_BRAFL|nr:E3 ubiquitin-protein ligase TRIM71-like [Branchiostoma floridae]
MPTVSSATINPRNVTLPPSANSSQSATLTLASNSSQGATLTSTNISSGATTPTTINIPHGSTLPSTTKRSQLSPIFNTSQGTHGIDSPTEKITFGGTGSDPGRFKDNRGVAVSADNEIFVTDKRNKRVQVFNINGDFLRLFPTSLLPKGDEEMLPSDISIDGEGHLWVVGRKESYFNAPVHVVQYNRIGLPLTTFEVPGPTWSIGVAITVDLHNDKILVILLDEILMFQPNGSFCRSIGKGLHQYEYATSDNSGRILVTDYSHSKVQVYNHTGHWLFGFGGFGRGDGQLIRPSGVCTDSSGRVIVANDGNGRVDMFTSRGEFVRTVVEMDKSWGIAVGPDGHLVVTNVYDNTVTIFPATMIFP